MGEPDMFGSPSSLLFRADLIRSRAPEFYNRDFLHADSEICFDLLRTVDFGFVQQALTFTRRHNESISSFARVIETMRANPLYRLIKYGRDFLSADEYAQCLRKAEKVYYRFLGLRLVQNYLKPHYRSRRKDFWEYHHATMAQVGYSIDRFRVVRAAFAVMYNKFVQSLLIEK